MAFNVGASSASGRLGRSVSRRSGSTLSDINVVPLVDVVLVLLIIFMLTAQAMESGMKIDVPQVKSVESDVQSLPVVNVSSTGSVMLGDTALNLNLIPNEIHRKFKNATAVYVRADRKVTYNELAQVISALSEAKFNINLVMTPAEIQRK